MRCGAGVLAATLLAAAACSLLVVAEDRSAVMTANVHPNMMMDFAVSKDTNELFVTLAIKEGDWVGVGFSDQPLMRGADIYVASLVDNEATVIDMHGTQEGKPMVDTHQDVKGVFEDYALTTGATYVLWAFGSGSVPLSMQKHADGHRGVIVIDFSALANHSAPTGGTDEAVAVDVAVAARIVPAALNSEWCQGTRLPEPFAAAKSHVVKTAPKLDAAAGKWVQQVEVMRCAGLAADDALSGFSGSCQMLPERLQQCRNESAVVATWSPGPTDAFVYPPNVGVPVGAAYGGMLLTVVRYVGRDDNDTVTHYPDVIDRTGMQLFITSKVRTEDAAVLMVGISPVAQRPYTATLASMGKFNVSGLCHNACTEKALSKPAHVMAVSTAFAGSVGAAFVDHLRVGKGQLTPLFVSESVTTHFQAPHYLGTPADMLANDGMIVTCTSQIETGAVETVGFTPVGPFMQCVAYLHYYPAPEEPGAGGACASALAPTVLDEYAKQQVFKKEKPDATWSAEKLTGVWSDPDAIDWQKLRAARGPTEYGDFLGRYMLCSAAKDKANELTRWPHVVPRRPIKSTRTQLHMCPTPPTAATTVVATVAAGGAGTTAAAVTTMTTTTTTTMTDTLMHVVANCESDSQCAAGLRCHESG